MQRPPYPPSLAGLRICSAPVPVLLSPVLPWEAQPIADVRRAQCWPGPAVSAAGGAVCPEHPLSGTVPSFLVAGTQSNSQQGSLARAQGCVRGSMAVCVCVFIGSTGCVCVRVWVHFPSGFPSALWLTRPPDTALSWINVSVLSFSERILLFHPNHNYPTGLFLRTPTHVNSM